MWEFVPMMFIISLAFCAVDGGAQDDTAETIIAMEKAALERWGNGDPQGYIEIAAADITYFDPVTEMRINGIEAFRAHLEPVAGTIFFNRFELLNPRVSASGDLAVLSFNFVSYSEVEGETVVERWNCTEVYRRTEEGWRITHSHWSLTQSMPVQDN